MSTVLREFSFAILQAVARPGQTEVSGRALRKNQTQNTKLLEL
jgi:hypothetical protein